MMVVVQIIIWPVINGPYGVAYVQTYVMLYSRNCSRRLRGDRPRTYAISNVF